jgi:hypothetical protein
MEPAVIAKGTAMLDLIMVAAGVGLFVLAIAYVHACDLP